MKNRWIFACSALQQQRYPGHLAYACYNEQIETYFQDISGKLVRGDGNSIFSPELNQHELIPITRHQHIEEYLRCAGLAP